MNDIYDSGSALMLIPDPIHHGQLQNDSEYVVIIRPNTGELNFVGPFRPTTSILPITGRYPFTGNFSVRGILGDEARECTILIPKDGCTMIFRMEFSLHLYTPDLKEIMTVSLQVKGDWMRTARGDDH